MNTGAMWRFVVRRLLWTVVLVFAVTIITYAVFFLLPGDPASLAAGRGASQRSIAMVRKLLHFDEPVWKQYGRFVWNLFAHGSLGYSYVNREEVARKVGEDLPVTASLIVGGVLIVLLVSVPIGIISALRPRTLLDRLSMIFVLIGISMQPVWLGLVLSYVFGYWLGWTPIAGYCNAVAGPFDQCGGAIQWASHLILPWITFSVLFAALYVRMIRAQLMEAMHEDYVRTARAKGLSELRVVVRHAVRNSMLPIVTILGMDLGLAFGTALFIEQTFGLPGIGRELFQASNRLDLPTIVGIVMVVALIVVMLNLIVDILYGFLDPRIRMADAVRLG